MKFCEFLHIKNEDANYAPEVFDDETTGQSEPTEVKTPMAPVTATSTEIDSDSVLKRVITRYFNKGSNDAIKSLDGFANDLVNALNDFCNKDWINDEEFKGHDDSLIQFKNKVKNICDARINKIGTAIHDLGVQIQNTKNSAIK